MYVQNVDSITVFMVFYGTFLYRFFVSSLLEVWVPPSNIDAYILVLFLHF